MPTRLHMPDGAVHGLRWVAKHPLARKGRGVLLYRHSGEALTGRAFFKLAKQGGWIETSEPGRVISALGLPLEALPRGAIRTYLVVPDGESWPVEGRDPDGSLRLRPGFVEAVERASGMEPGTLTEDMLADLLRGWYVERRRAGEPPCPWMEKILDEIAAEDGIDRAQLDRMIRGDGDEPAGRA